MQLEVPSIDDYTPTEKLRLEREVLGFTLSANEMALYTESPAVERVVPCRALADYAGQEVTVAGMIAAGRRHLTKGGEWMLFLSLQDTTGLMEAVLFPDAYKASGTIIANNGGGPYLMTGTVQVAGNGWGKGRGVGVQLADGMRTFDAVALKTHAVIIARKVEPLRDSLT